MRKMLFFCAAVLSALTASAPARAQEPVHVPAARQALPEQTFGTLGDAMKMFVAVGTVYVSILRIRSVQEAMPSGYLSPFRYALLKVPICGGNITGVIVPSLAWIGPEQGDYHQSARTEPQVDCRGTPLPVAERVSFTK